MASGVSSLADLFVLDPVGHGCQSTWHSTQLLFHHKSGIWTKSCPTPSPKQALQTEHDLAFRLKSEDSVPEWNGDVSFCSVQSQDWNFRPKKKWFGPGCVHSLRQPVRDAALFDFSTYLSVDRPRKYYSVKLHLIFLTKYLSTHISNFTSFLIFISQNSPLNSLCAFMCSV